MSSDTTAGDPPAQKATDEQLVEAVERVARTLDAPAVPTSQVAAELPIKRQTVKRRLDDLATEGRVASLSTGQGRIWWVSDDGGGHVDPAALDQSVDLDALDPHDIPPDVAREIAAERVTGFDPPETFWERLYDWSEGRADDVVTLLALALVVLLLPSPGLFEAQLLALGFGMGLVEFLGVLVLFVAALLGVVAGGARTVGILGQWAAEQGYVDAEPFDESE
ncbi:hypothetical protein G9464_03320 [Halostella sp. JP-L12]|uniref:hypothetical protein n=1 Tax=Halostella TaxID=1843185 RepID=UPI000EF7C28A|nr:MULTISPECIES: hypothetical protein [Halostella]NHN46626.1 hypothetical protein [Halostella sp. JP-L12]